jgi:hypothetical protein
MGVQSFEKKPKVRGSKVLSYHKSLGTKIAKCYHESLGSLNVGPTSQRKFIKCVRSFPITLSSIHFANVSS